MSSTDFLEYTKHLIREELPEVKENQVAVLAGNFINKARQQVDKRAKVRKVKAMKRGIELTNTRIVSKEVYHWYKNLSSREHEEQFGFKRQELEIKQQDIDNINDGVVVHAVNKGKLKQVRPITKQTYNRNCLPNPIVGLVEPLHERNYYQPPNAVVAKYQKRHEYHSRLKGKENHVPQWTYKMYSTTYNDYSIFSKSGIKRKSPDTHQLSNKRQRNG